MMLNKFIIFLSFLFISYNVSIASERGIYSFGLGQNFIETETFSIDELAGMTAYFLWEDLEPVDGKFDFNIIDNLLIKAKQNGKKLNIGIYPGSFSPHWLYDKNITSFSWFLKYREDRRNAIRKNGEWKSTPLPWDDKYLFYWKRFVTHLAEKYKNDESVGYISLTGPCIDTLSTGIILKDREDWDRFVLQGYTLDKLYKSWCNVIEHYQVVFEGKKTLVIALGPEKPGSTNTVLADKIADYVISRDYRKISFMSVFLNDTWFTYGGGALGIRKIFKKVKSNGFAFGYQMAGSARLISNWKNDYKVIKSLRKSLEIGISDGASWIEIWHGDLFVKSQNGLFRRYDKFVPDIKFASRILLQNK